MLRAVFMREELGWAMVAGHYSSSSGTKPMHFPIIIVFVPGADAELLCICICVYVSLLQVALVSGL